ncbi:hypothetical protein Dimus_017675 [Dionaea muscipula]
MKQRAVGKLPTPFSIHQSSVQSFLNMSLTISSVCPGVCSSSLSQLTGEQFTHRGTIHSTLEIPLEINNLKSLQVLHLWNNSLTGPLPSFSYAQLPAKVVEAVLPDEAVAPARICFAVTDAAAGLLACGGGCSSSGWWLSSEERWLMWIWARGLVTSRRWLLSATRIWDLAEADLG